MQKNGLKPRTEMVVLGIEKVAVSSCKHHGGAFDVTANKFVQNAQFAHVKSDQGKLTAQVPKDGIFLLEYDSESLANQKPARIVSKICGIYREVEIGKILFIPESFDPSGKKEVLFIGDNVRDWEIMCWAPGASIVEEFKLTVLQGKILKPTEKALVVKGGEDTHLGPPSDDEEESSASPPIDVPEDFLKAPKKVTVRSSPVMLQRITTPTTPVSVNELRTESILQIPLDEIVVFQKQESDPSFSGQPRKEFVESDLDDLARNLQEHGQLIPGLVKRLVMNGVLCWELIAGERRWRALKKIKAPFFKAIEMKPKDKKDQHMLALVENLYRKDPNPLDISNALQEQLDAGETQLSLAKQTSLSSTQIQKYLAIQSLVPELKPFLKSAVPDEDRIRLSAAHVLGKIHPNHQVWIWNEAKKQPSQGLVIAKIHELGRSLFVAKRQRGNDRWHEGSEVNKRATRRLKAFELALLQLRAITPEEWQTFAQYVGADICRGHVLELGNAKLAIEHTKLQLEGALSICAHGVSTRTIPVSA